MASKPIVSAAVKPDAVVRLDALAAEQDTTRSKVAAGLLERALGVGGEDGPAEAIAPGRESWIETRARQLHATGLTMMLARRQAAGEYEERYGDA